MRKLSLLYIAVVAVVSFAANAGELSPAAQLRKLSLQARGKLPSTSEYQEIDRLTKDQTQAYLLKKTEEYLKSAEGLNMATNLMEEAMRFSLPESMPEQINSVFSSENIMFRNNIRSILEKTHSIDAVLGADNLNPNSNNSNLANASMDTAFSPFKINQKGPKLSDSLVSTYRFTDRYRQTRYSRAAAFSRIYLCNDLKPIILNKGSQRADNANVGINEGPEASRKTEDGKSIVHEDMFKKTLIVDTNSVADLQAHQKPQCKACHRILDPIRNLTERFEPKVTMVYDDDLGNEQKVEIPSADEFIGTTQKLHQYQRCQVKRLLNWFIGEDYFWTFDQIDDWVKVYNISGGDYVKFAQQLVAHKAFGSDSHFSETTTIDNVQPVLNKCWACHSTSDDLAPQVNILPFTLFGGPDEHIEIVKTMFKKLALSKDGDGASMPPDSAGWKLSRVQRLAMSRFMFDGARKFDGNTTLTQPQVDELFKDFTPTQLARIQDRNPVPTFRPTWRRYLKGYDLYRVLDQVFPGVIKRCEPYFDDTKKSILGFNVPNFGAPSADEPSNLFEEDIDKCVRQFYTAADLSKMNWEKLGPSLTGSEPWTKFASTPQAKAEWVESLIVRFVGLGVMKLEAIATLKDQIVRTLDLYLKPGDSLKTATYWTVYYIISDENFRTF